MDRARASSSSSRSRCSVSAAYRDRPPTAGPTLCLGHELCPRAVQGAWRRARLLLWRRPPFAGWPPFWMERPRLAVAPPPLRGWPRQVSSLERLARAWVFSPGKWTRQPTLPEQVLVFNVDVGQTGPASEFVGKVFDKGQDGVACALMDRLREAPRRAREPKATMSRGGLTTPRAVSGAHGRHVLCR